MKDMTPRTPRQEEIFQYILRFIKDNEFPPSRQEIADAFTISRPCAHEHLTKIERKGYLKIIPNISRGIVILHEN